MMFRSLLLACGLLISASAWGQSTTGQNGAVFSFKETQHDFGKVILDSALTYTFEFTNIGNAMLMITAIEPSCHCVTANWRRAPVMPGETGTIAVTYSAPIGEGKFNRALWIASNATNVDPNTMRFELRVLGEGVKSLPRKRATSRTKVRVHQR
jgi:hypothetical protein